MLIMDDMAGRRALIEASGLQTGRVLDVGMGNCGCMAIFLARDGFHVVGIDRSSEAVRRSIKDAQDESFPGTFEERVANAEKLPFGENEFDAVFAYHALHHMKNVEQVIAEMFRVCKPSGFVLIADLNAKGCKVYKESVDEILLNTIECCMKENMQSVRKVETEYNFMFICQK